MTTTIIAAAVGTLIVAFIVLAVAARRGRGTKALLNLGSVSPQWLQSHRQQEEL